MRGQAERGWGGGLISTESISKEALGCNSERRSPQEEDEELIIL